MKTLLQYLADLARDPVAQQAFEKDPDTKVKALVKSGNRVAMDFAPADRDSQNAHFVGWVIP